MFGVHVYVCAHECVPTCVWKPEDNLRCHSSYIHFYFYFWHGVSHCTGTHQIGYPAPRIHLFLPPWHWGHKHPPPCPYFSFLLWGAQIQVLTLAKQALSHLSYLFGSVKKPFRTRNELLKRKLWLSLKTIILSERSQGKKRYTAHDSPYIKFFKKQINSQ